MSSLASKERLRNAPWAVLLILVSLTLLTIPTMGLLSIGFEILKSKLGIGQTSGGGGWGGLGAGYAMFVFGSIFGIGSIMLIGAGTASFYAARRALLGPERPRASWRTLGMFAGCVGAVSIASLLFFRYPIFLIVVNAVIALIATIVVIKDGASGDENDAAKEDA